MTMQRAYSDSEVALILQRATALQHERTATGDGVTLEQLRDAAAQIGMDPDLVVRAAAELSVGGGNAGSRLLGGGYRQEMRLTHDTGLDTAQVHALVLSIRGALGEQGKVQEVLGGVEWQTVGVESQISVTVRAEATQTKVQVLVDRTGAAVLTTAGFGALGTFAAAIAGSIIEPGVAGGLLLMGSGVASGLAAAHAVWRMNTRSLNRRVARLMDTIRDAFEGQAEDPGES